ncbi:hypothetical protein C0J52_22056 [Blattella germanica]|nr:hypothetical protein C0J52_22056 [Blattella germanica]
MSHPAIVKWCQEFEQGCTDVGDADQEERTSTSTIEDIIQKIDEMICSNCRVSITEIAQQFIISIGSAHSIVLRCLHDQGADLY